MATDVALSRYVFDVRLAEYIGPGSREWSQVRSVLRASPLGLPSTTQVDANLQPANGGSTCRCTVSVRGAGHLPHEDVAARIRHALASVDVSTAPPPALRLTCRELMGDTLPGSTIRKAQYEHLHPPEVRKLIQGWFDRAWAMRGCSTSSSYEPFIFAWMAFNGWAACVTGEDQDREWRVRLMLDEGVNADFAAALEDAQSPLLTNTQEFRELWPVFKARELRHRQLRCRGNRCEVVDAYLRAGITDFEPGCWARHREAGEGVPLDWPHTLAALYSVRCNLFHGEKSADFEADTLMVFRAFRVLVHILEHLLGGEEEEE